MIARKNLEHQSGEDSEHSNQVKRGGVSKKGCHVAMILRELSFYLS